MRAKDGEDLAIDAMKGALAGAIGVWALDLITWYMWDREDLQALEQEVRTRPGGLDPAHATVNLAAEALGTELSPKQPHPAGIVFHYAFGMGPGALYAALRKRGASVRPGRGILFGLALAFLQDNILNRLLGLSGPLTKYPWQAHARGLVGHSVYGAVMDASVAYLDEISERPGSVRWPRRRVRGEPM